MKLQYWKWKHADGTFDEFIQSRQDSQVDRWNYRFGGNVGDWADAGVFAGNAGPDYVLRLEELDGDLTALMAAFELPPLEVPHMNCAAERDGKSPKIAFTKKMLDVINTREADMFQGFGYDKIEKLFELDGA